MDVCAADDETLSKIRRRKIGYIFQDFNLIPILTAEENIIMPLLLDGKKPDKTKLRELTGFLGIENRLKHLPSELSGGQKQRVAIARALATHRESRQKGGGRDHGAAARRQPLWKHRAFGDA